MLAADAIMMEHVKCLEMGTSMHGACASGLTAENIVKVSTLCAGSQHVSVVSS